MNIRILPAILAVLTAFLGLTQNSQGYRDPETGTFISRDPAGFVDGPNVYGYVRQNPWTKFDPYGLYETGGGDPFDRNTPRWTSTTGRDGKPVVKVIHGGDALRSDAAVESFNAKQSGNWEPVLARAKHMAELDNKMPGIAALSHRDVVAGVNPEYNAKLNSWADTMAAISPADMVNPNRIQPNGGAKAGKGNPTGSSAQDIHKQNTETVANTGSTVAKTTPPINNLTEQAADLVPLNGGRNRITLRSPSQQMEVDLAGKAHGGVPTPHTKVSPLNPRAPNQPAYNTKNSPVEPATQQDIRTVRRFLERQN